jgi:carbon storage regulator CsrA
MLVLSRKEKQVIFIGDNIKITVIDVFCNRVRIGVDAPRGTAIVRQEIRDTARKRKDGKDDWPMQ